ncbi:MAG: hypothetical protein V4622_09100 [Bacteroidota bacterium]
MLKKIIFILFYLSIILTIFFGISFFLGFLELIESVHYTLILMSVNLFLVVILLQDRLEKRILKALILIPLFVGFILWNCSLIQLFDIQKTGLEAFLCMIFSLVFSIFALTTQKASQMMKLLSGFSMAMLLFTIYFTSEAVFDNSMLLISSLSLFTLFCFISYFFPEKKK